MSVNTYLFLEGEKKSNEACYLIHKSVSFWELNNKVQANVGSRTNLRSDVLLILLISPQVQNWTLSSLIWFRIIFLVFDSKKNTQLSFL